MTSKPSTVKPRPHAREDSPALPPKKPLVFISHDSRDAKLAHLFVALLTGATGGVLKSFCASESTAGIPYGAKWYETICGKLSEATDVVVLATPNSIDRPWVLFEAGFARGRGLERVSGVAFGGIGLSQMKKGPFTQSHNCKDDENSLTGLVLQLIKENLVDANPLEEAVRLQVQEFRKRVARNAQFTGDASPPADGDEAAARILEEVKLIADNFKKSSRDFKRHSLTKALGPHFFEEFSLRPAGGPTSGYDDIPWLMFIGILRDDLPWVYEVGLELYRALLAGDGERVRATKARVLHAVRMTAENDWFRSIIAESNRELAFQLFNLPYLVESYLSQIEPLGPDSAHP